MNVVNLAIMKNPANWIKVPVMAAFGMIALYLIAQVFKAPTAPADE